MNVSFPKKLKEYIKKAVPAFLVASSILMTPTNLQAQNYNYKNVLTQHYGQYAPPDFSLSDVKKDVHSVRAVYYINNILKEVIEDIESNRDWHDKFFYLEDYTDFNFNNFLNIYKALLDMENDIIKNKLHMYNYDTKLKIKDKMILQAENIKNEIKNLLHKSPRNYQTFIKLINKYEQLMEIKNHYENNVYSNYSTLSQEIFLGHYKSNDSRIGDISAYPLFKVDKILLNKVIKWKTDLINNVASHQGWFLRFFGKSIKHAQPIEKTYQEVTSGINY